MLGFQIRTEEGSRVGVIEDCIADDRSWHIRYLVVNATEWSPHRKLLLAPAWSRTVNWAEEKIRMDLTSDAVRASPVYDPSETLNRGHEARLYEHYGRRKYWMFR
jgi:sporulation protein YlmC with PRC-barrel domain